MASECFLEIVPQKQALIIGPSYRFLPADKQLEGTKNDLEIMKTILRKQSFQLNGIKELSGEDATKENILLSMAEITRQAVKGSVLAVYYSGHGCHWRVAPDSADWDEGLLPADITPQDSYSKCVSGADLQKYLLELSNKDVSVTLIFDCCFGGHMYRGTEFDNGDFKCSKAREVNLASLRTIERDTIEREETPGNLTPRGETNKTGPERPWRKISEGWLPQEEDKFFHLAACSSIEKAYEGIDDRTNGKCGRFTWILRQIFENLSESSTMAHLSYKALFSLIQRHFKKENISNQTPQMEGGNLDTVVFSHSVVPQTSKLFDIDDVTLAMKAVQLHAGCLQLLQGGEYDVFEPTVSDSEIGLGKNSEFWVGAIEVHENDIGMIKAGACIIDDKKGKEILPGCKASLRKTHKAHTIVNIISSIPEDRMNDKLLMTQMFKVRKMEPYPEFTQFDEVVLQKEFIESDEHWCARMKGNMIVPPVYTNEEDVMADNLVKYFRYRLALEQPPSNENLLLNVKLKVSEFENVRPFVENPTLRNEMLEEARSKPDLFAECKENPNSPMPRLQAHKSSKKLVKGILEDTLIDETGDAIAVRVTNNEESTIHVLLLMFQLDGSIRVMYPPRKGASIELPSGASREDIFRLSIPEYALEKFTQPDPTKEVASEGIDKIMLYAASEPFDMGALVQPALDLGRKRRGKEKGISEKINPLEDFWKALRLKNRCLEDVNPSGKWLTEKREFVVVKSTANGYKKARLSK